MIAHTQSGILTLKIIKPLTVKSTDNMACLSSTNI